MTTAKTEAAPEGTATSSTAEGFALHMAYDASAAALDVSRLDKVKQSGGKTVAACPACRELGHDKKGDHLFIGADGRFGCVAFPGDGEHRKRIFALVGVKGEPTRTAPRKAAPRTAPTWPTLEAAAAAITPQGHALASLYPYGASAGVARYEGTDGKTFRQFKRVGQVWALGAPASLWSLFGEIQPEGTVWIVEGEKCQEAAASIDLCAVTSAGGSKGAAKTDWKPLAGREVVILPDNDGDGEGYAADVAKILRELDPPARVRIVKLPGLPPKGDVADWIDERDAHEPEALRAEVERMAADAPEVEADADELAATDAAEVSPVSDGRKETSPTNGQKGGRDPATKDVADAFISSQGRPFPIKKHRGQWYLFDVEIYRPFSQDDLKGRVVLFLRHRRPNYATKNMAANVMEHLIAPDVGGVESRFSMPCWLPSGDDAAGWMAMSNCLVNIEGLARNMGGGAIVPEAVIRPHTHELFSTFALPYAYDPEATCPKWTEYMEGVQPDPQMRELLQMLFGLLLVPDCRYEVFFILYGEAGCGKTVLLHVLENVIGAENVCVLPLSKFAEKHSTHLLTENLANILGDLPTNDGHGGSLQAIEGILKDTVSGGLLSCERKNQEPYKAHAIARCVFATNSLPTFTDRSSGVWDRLRVVPFDVRFRGTEKQNPHLKEEIVAAELPGVFLWAVEGLAMLRKLRQFPRGPRGAEIEARHRADCDHERTFLLDGYAVRNGAFTESQGIYSAYRTFCADSGYRAKGASNFSAEVRRVFPSVLDERRMVAGARVRGYLNLGPIALHGGGEELL